MKIENDNWSLGYSKAQKERASAGGEAVRTDPTNSGGHYEKKKWTGGASAAARLRRNKTQKERASAGREAARTDPTNS